MCMPTSSPSEGVRAGTGGAAVGRAQHLRLLVWIVPAASLLYVASSLQRVVRSAWTVLMVDQWGLYGRYLTESLPGNIVSLHNGHSLAVPGLVYLMDIRLTDAGNWLAIGVGIGLIGVAAALVSRLSLTEPAVPWTYRLAFASLSWILLFWQGNARILGDIAGVPVGLVLLSVAVAALGLVHYRESMHGGGRARRTALLGVTLGAGVIATFSYGFGVNLWPAILAVGLLLGLSWKSFGVLVGGGLVGAVASYLYLLPGSGKARGALSFAEPLRIVDAGVSWLGGPAFHVLRGPVSDSGAATAARVLGVLGIAGAGLAIIGLYRRRRSGSEVGRLEVWCVLAVTFGLGCAAQVAVARAAMTEEYSIFMFGPRYLAWVMHFWLAIVILTGLYSSRLRRGGRSSLIWWAAILPLPLVLLPTHRAYGTVHDYMKWRAREAALSLIVGVRDEARVRGGLKAPPAKIYALAPILRDRRLNMFRSEPAQWLGRPLEEVARKQEEPGVWGGVHRVSPLDEPGGSGAHIVGWAFDPTSREVPEYVVAVDGRDRVRGVAVPSRRRPALAEMLELPPDTRLTFGGYIDVSYRPSETYRFYAISEAGESSIARELRRPPRLR